MFNNDFEGSRLEFLEILVGQGEEPAFLRRSRAVVESLQAFHDRLRSQREQLLEASRVALGVLAIRIDDQWTTLRPYLANPDDFRFYQDLYLLWQPDQDQVARALRNGWRRGTQRELRKFHDRIARFNESWQARLHRIDLQSVNQMLSDYNVYYPLEKTCAFGNEDIERLGFNPTEPVSRAELEREYPAILLPKLAK